MSWMRDYTIGAYNLPMSMSFGVYAHFAILSFTVAGRDFT